MGDATIFDKLQDDHRKHRELLARLGSAEGADERRQLFGAFRLEVTAHAAAEEETLYATMLADPDLRHDAQHSVSEHKEVEDYLEEMDGLDVASPAWSELFDKMRHRYLHHIDEEEEDMFPAAEAGIADSIVERLGERFDERKPAELERAEAGADEGDDRD